jgi:branched-chain amino acid transport system substrate-binding protein
MAKRNDSGITRRDFIKKVSVSTAAVGVSSAFPMLITPAKAASRDHILIGRIQPATGPMAAFSEPSPWIDEKALGELNAGGGIYIKEFGKQVPVKIKVMDTQSDPNKAAEAASKLILRDKVDLIYASHAPATVNPVAQICERFKIPCLGDNLPNEMFLAGGKYHWAFSAGPKVGEGFMAAYMDMWTQVSTNKVVGLLAGNETDGIAFAQGSNAMLPGAGYKLIDAGRFPAGNMDFSAIISLFKKNNVEILFGNLTPPDFARAWRQCFQMDFLPKICSIGRAIFFPSAVEALGGDIGLGTSTECPWHPSFPFKSSMANYKSQGLADAYETAKGKQWTEPIGFVYGGYEIIGDVLKRAKTLDKETIRKAFAATNMTTVMGPVKFNEQNVTTYPAGAQQWIKGKKFQYDSRLVSAGSYGHIIQPEGSLLSLQEIRGSSSR